MTELVVHSQQFDTPSKALAHYGVKGMRWGVRKKEDPLDAPNPAYSSALRRKDSQLGKKSVRNINRSMNEGLSHKEAQKKELRRVRRNTVLILAGGYAALNVLANKDVVAYKISERAETNRGRAAAANVWGLPSEPHRTPVARRRRGAYRVTNL